MGSLNGDIREYAAQLKKGSIQKAYKGIMAFMSELKTYLEREHEDCASGALYFGYMDMTYFAFTPPELKKKNLKVAIVFIHEGCRFELWLAGNNRKIQAEYIELLSRKNTGRFKVSQVRPGVDSIIEMPIAGQPDFDNPEELKRSIETETMDFIKEINLVL